VERTAVVAPSIVIAICENVRGQSLNACEHARYARAPKLRGCAYPKLNCAISVMKPTENRPRNDRTKALDRTMDWSVLVQCSMGPRCIIYVLEAVG
jgi:hypothetical protein